MLIIRRVLSVVCMLLISGSALPQSYPVKPIRIITAEVSGGIDIAARIMAPGLSSQMGQPVVVENRASFVLPDVVAKAAPDGYTLMVYNNGLWIRPFMADVSYDALRDFVPITWATQAPLAILVNPSLPVHSVKELVALAKAKPGTLNYSTGGSGSASHLAPELLRKITGINMVRVPYKSGAMQIADLMKNQVQLSFVGGGSVSGLLKAGKLRAIAVASEQPSALYPGLPTINQSGIPGFVATQIYGLLAPAKVPAPIVTRLNQESVKYLHLDSTTQQSLNAGQEVVGSTPEEFTATIKADMERWGKLIKDAGIREDE